MGKWGMGNLQKKIFEELCVVLSTYNPSIKEMGQEDHEFKASLGYIARPRLLAQKVSKKYTLE